MIKSKNLISSIIKPGGIGTILFIVMFGLIGAALAGQDNTVAAVLLITILVGIANDESSKRLMKVQREYIDVLEIYAEISKDD